ncbi:hypothetical protein ACQPZQ_02915 [Pseudonocardia sp. CA-142604]|uniref:hypothetical protein n=1 Tax=Pseudonocardia sp. CA-142604 TaxID=3240024 RepID=UPI003D92C3C1
MKVLPADGPGHGGARPRGQARRFMRAAAIAAAALLLSACAGLEPPEVEQVASAFAGADPSARCQMLAPATASALEGRQAESCVQAMSQLSLPRGAVVSSTVSGDQAQVQLVGDTVFLTLTSDGWKVTAAGCRSQADARYDCRLEGP